MVLITSHVYTQINAYRIVHYFLIHVNADRYRTVCSVILEGTLGLGLGLEGIFKI
jgi:hypothetical protein